MSPEKERRKFPRIKDEDISLELQGEGFNTISQSLDVSASGIYCKVDRHIPLMSRLQIVLTLPGKKNSSPRKLTTEGVVVREHPVKKDSGEQYYDIAIFFSSLTRKERETISAYIDKRDK